ncbi:MAG: B12-binding domain-containing radical SAM protein, partial [Thermodesulfovibrionales bacterium]
MKGHFDLSRVLRPSRYINNELNSVHKRSLVRVALAFPDIYDVGMSHLGLRILYNIINNIPYASAERAFSPWPDMESEMRRLNLPLCTLESKDSLRNFDIVGFSLQYELSYPTVLNMLDLSGIPIRAEDRGDDDPIILAGGPCAVNPIPMSSFIDAFLIGDGEEAIGEIIDVVYQSK